MLRLSFRRLSLPGALGSILLVAPTGFAAVPAGFQDSLVVGTLGGPTALAFTPDGRLLITRQLGVLRVFGPSGLVATPALTLSGVCSNSERGLLGVAVDPDFATNNYIYVYYTTNASGTCQNRVSRFVLPAGNVINPATETVLLDNIHSIAGNHNAGDVQFGKDGYLYVSVGDGGCDYAGDSGCAGGQRRDPRPSHPPRQDPAHHPRRRHASGQPVRGPGHRELPHSETSRRD